jgi:colicin import membrane protein
MSRAVVLLPVLALLSAGLSACVTGGDRRADLIPVFHGQIHRCYVLPERAKASEVSVLELRLNPDGSLAQPPKVVRGTSGSLSTRAAVNAVKRCAPFDVPVRIIRRYSEWKVMQVAFETE